MFICFVCCASKFEEVIFVTKLCRFQKKEIGEFRLLLLLQSSVKYAKEVLSVRVWPIVHAYYLNAEIKNEPLHWNM